METGTIILAGFLASLLAGLATGLGAMAVFCCKSISPKVKDAMLGFSAGVMLAASSFSLIIPGIEEAHVQTGSSFYASLIMAAGILLGAAVLWLANSYLPHEHFIKGVEGASVQQIRRIWLFVFAITLHNFPEGLAVGVGFGSENIASAIVLAIGIGLQNMPEGLAVALSLLSLGYSRRYSFVIALLSGLVEPIGGIMGAGFVSLAKIFLPCGMAFAAGAMLYVISHEIIPETHRKGHEQAATWGLMLGFVVMMFLDIIFA